MNMIELYQSLLKAAGMTAGSDGSVSIVVGKHKEPMTIGGKRLVIPTKEQMQKRDWSNRVSFHILSENVLRGETEVFSVYRKALVRKLNLSLCMIAAELIHIAASPALHKKLRPAQSKFLLGMSDADEKTLTTFKKLIERMPVDDPNRAIVSIYMKRNGTVEKMRYPRVGVVSFPLYEELSETDNSVWGLKTRVKDMVMLRNLLEYMIPGMADPNQTYDVGSKCTIAPYTTALMRTFSGLVIQMNELIELHWGKDSEMWETCSINTDWLDLMLDLTPLLNEIRLTPSQETNEGKESETPAPVETQPAPQPTVTAQPTVAATPVVNTAPVVNPTPVVNTAPVVNAPVAPMYAGAVAPSAPAAQTQNKPGNSIDDIINMKYRSMGYAAAPYAPPAAPAPVPAQPYGQPQPVFVGYDQYGRPVYQQPQATVGLNGWTTQPAVNTAPTYAPNPNSGMVYTGQVGSHGYPVRA